MELTPYDFWLLERDIDSYFIMDFSYWEKRVSQRIEFLSPLINELKCKGINLSDISKSLYQEHMNLIAVDRKLKILSSHKK